MAVLERSLRIRYRRRMGAADTTGQDLAGGEKRARGLLQVTIACGLVTVVLVAATAALFTLQFFDRHYALSDGLRELWELLATIADTAPFVVLYVVIPPAWAALTVRWWVARPMPRRWFVWVAMVPLLIAGAFGAWAWLATALRHSQWVFGVDPLPQSLTSLGVSDVDRWEALAVAGLLCLIACVIAGSAAMLSSSRR